VFSQTFLVWGVFANRSDIWETKITLTQHLSILTRCLSILTRHLSNLIHHLSTLFSTFIHSD